MDVRPSLGGNPSNTESRTLCRSEPSQRSKGFDLNSNTLVCKAILPTPLSWRFGMPVPPHVETQDLQHMLKVTVSRFICRLSLPMVVRHRPRELFEPSCSTSLSQASWISIMARKSPLELLSVSP